MDPQDPRDYLLTTEPGEHHDLRITWIESHKLIYISSNSRTMGMSPSMARELMRGLLAVLDGGFMRALSEDNLRRELESRSRSARSASAESTTRPTTPQLKPGLDML